ncbi:unnamed protein product [Staurois parvus]|uniref:Uncharacterized protein n=1 Tax=Staurois parvus TaxID=386267 RepID=A0ABN9CM64_9NEOB|nr:unnamed protein product [Staurois parvus]
MHCVKKLFDPVFSDPSLPPQSPIHLLIVQSSRNQTTQFGVYCSRGFFILWEGACDQQMANQRCPDRGSGLMQPHRTVRAE